ncbi:MAG: hypothetical protein ACPGVV_12135, partial [Croceimicrobium sp.]
AVTLQEVTGRDDFARLSPEERTPEDYDAFLTGIEEAMRDYPIVSIDRRPNPSYFSGTTRFFQRR